MFDDVLAASVPRNFTYIFLLLAEVFAGLRHPDSRLGDPCRRGSLGQPGNCTVVQCIVHLTIPFASLFCVLRASALWCYHPFPLTMHATLEPSYMGVLG